MAARPSWRQLQNDVRVANSRRRVDPFMATISEALRRYGLDEDDWPLRCDWCGPTGRRYLTRLWLHVHRLDQHAEQYADSAERRDFDRRRDALDNRKRPQQSATPHRNEPARKKAHVATSELVELGTAPVSDEPTRDDRAETAAPTVGAAPLPLAGLSVHVPVDCRPSGASSSGRASEDSGFCEEAPASTLPTFSWQFRPPAPLAHLYEAPANVPVVRPALSSVSLGAPTTLPPVSTLIPQQPRVARMLAACRHRPAAPHFIAPPNIRQSYNQQLPAHHQLRYSVYQYQNNYQYQNDYQRLQRPFTVVPRPSQHFALPHQQTLRNHLAFTNSPPYQVQPAPVYCSERPQEKTYTQL